jgi:hypothetical protein
MAFFQSVLSEWNKIWIYFVITIPVTFLSLGAWLWYERTEKSNKGLISEGRDEVGSCGSSDEGIGFQPVLRKRRKSPSSSQIKQRDVKKKRFRKLWRRKKPESDNADESDNAENVGSWAED